MRFSANIRQRQDFQRGASLVEVLIVLVILVVGIFSIARLFPGGFFAVRSAENNTFADRLAQAQLETLKQNDAFLLDAVYMYSSAGGFIATDGPDDLTGTTAASYQGDPTLNDINKARYIEGETFNVPTANTGASNNGVSLHTLNYGPVRLPLQAFTALPPGTPPSIAGVAPVHTGPWAATVANSLQTVPTDTTGSYSVPGTGDTPTDALAPGQQKFLIDYANRRIAFPTAAYEQDFTLVMTCDFTTLTPRRAVLTFTLAVPASYTGGWVELYGSTYIQGTTSAPAGRTLPPITDPNLLWVPGTATLYRNLTPEPADAGGLAATLADMNAEADPYRYVLLNPAPSLSPITFSNVNLGTLAFSPRIAGQQVSVSYIAYDWHVIHEDVDVPDTPGTPIRLTLNHLKRVGDVQSDQTIYSGLFDPGDTSNTAVGNDDVVLLDTDTGDIAGLSVADTTHVFDLDNTSGMPTTDQFAVSYEGGRVTLPTDAADAWASTKHKHLRVYYKGDLDWGVSIQKAPSLYYQVNPNNSPSPHIDLVGAYGLSNLNPAYVEFPACDEGKVVEVDSITYSDKAVSPNPPVPHQVAVASGTITTDYKDSHYVDLTPFLDSNFDPSTIQIGAVRGISARAVVIWKERADWKTRSLDTILTRTQQ